MKLTEGIQLSTEAAQRALFPPLPAKPVHAGRIIQPSVAISSSEAPRDDWKSKYSLLPPWFFVVLLSFRVLFCCMFRRESPTDRLG